MKRTVNQGVMERGGDHVTESVEKANAWVKESDVV
jgi:hypothetical protein